MVWLSRFIAAVLVSVITIAVLTQVFDATLLNSNYLTKTANKSGVYSALSVDISNQLVKDFESQSSNNSISPTQASIIIRSVLTSSLIQSKVTDALAGVQAYYKGTGPEPSINLSDVIAKLQVAGLPISNNNSTLNKPIVIQGNEQVKQQVGNFEKVKLISSIVAVVLLLILIALSWEEHRWKVLPDLAIITGAWLGVISIIFIFGVSAADKVAKLNSNSNDFVNTANIYAKSLTKGVGELIGLVALTLLVIGFVVRILLHNIDKKKKPNKLQPSNSSLRLKSA